MLLSAGKEFIISGAELGSAQDCIQFPRQAQALNYADCRKGVEHRPEEEQETERHAVARRGIWNKKRRTVRCDAEVSLTPL